MSVAPELRLVRYFMAVADDLNFTRAAERLHMAQPPLSAAIRQLEEQLGVRLLLRSSRQVELTPAGLVLRDRGRKLLADADAVFAAVREVERAPVGRLDAGASPTSRFGIGPELFSAVSTGAPGVMLYTREATTGALLRDLSSSRLDLALLFCAPCLEDLAIQHLRDEPAVLHVRRDHPLAGRRSISLEELKDETILVSGGPDSAGFTARVIALCRAAGFEPRTVLDPHPDLGLQAVREGLGVVIYVRGAFGPELQDTVLVPIEPEVTFPFDLAYRADSRSGALEEVLAVARTVFPA